MSDRGVLTIPLQCHRFCCAPRNKFAIALIFTARVAGAFFVQTEIRKINQGKLKVNILFSLHL
ncbi:hypothetical protein BV375_21310 [Nostoc sp. 106C]|nr:hypothetical protein BV375_21310 [Nostoc sp. 106C]